MAYGIGPDEDVAETIVRNAREQLERAELALREQAGADPTKAIHAARRAIKKERSLLRLARESLPPQTRRATNSRLRDLARSLSSTRDAAVLMQTLDELNDRYAGQLPARAFASARKRLKAVSGSGGPDSAPDFARQLDELAAIRTEVDGWRLAGIGWSAVEAGVLRSYRAGRSAMTLGQREPSDENLHQWRKRTKDVWYHLQLLAPVGGPVVAGQAKQAEALSDLLGADHDLAILREKLLAMGDDLIERDGLLGLIDHRRDELQTEALFAGERLFAERRQAFRRRIRRSWKAGRAQARALRRRRPLELPRVHAARVRAGPKS